MLLAYYHEGPIAVLLERNRSTNDHCRAHAHDQREPALYVGRLRKQWLAPASFHGLVNFLAHTTHYLSTFLVALGECLLVQKTLKTTLEIVV